MSQKIQISKAGIGAGTAVNANDLTFSSDYNTLKYSTSGSITVTTGTAIGSVQAIGTVTHGLGYYPFFTVTMTDLGGYFGYQIAPTCFADAGYYGYEFSYADSQKLYFKVIKGNVWSSNTGIGTGIFHYKIFKNNLNL